MKVKFGLGKILIRLFNKKVDCGVLTGTTVSSAIATETNKAAQTNTILFMKAIFDTSCCFLDAFSGILNL